MAGAGTKKVPPRQVRRRPAQGPGNPATGVTIAEVVHYISQALRGNPADLCDLFDGLERRDGTLQSLIASRRAAIVGKQVQILPGADDDASKDVAEIFRTVWDALPTYELIWHHQHSGTMYGYAGSEIDWLYKPDAGRFDPVGFHHVPSRRFRIATELRQLYELIKKCIR